MKKRILSLLFLSISTLPSHTSRAEEEYRVYGARTDFGLTDKASRLKDFYVNLGTDQGVKQGSLLNVYRTISTADELNQKNAGNMTFRFARLRVIHAEGTSAVARLVEVLPEKNLPVLSYPTIMVGDRVEISSGRD